MNKTLLKSVREYKKQSLLSPLLVSLEVLMEVLMHGLRSTWTGMDGFLLK